LRFFLILTRFLAEKNFDFYQKLKQNELFGENLIVRRPASLHFVNPALCRQIFTQKYKAVTVCK